MHTRIQPKCANGNTFVFVSKCTTFLSGTQIHVLDLETIVWTKREPDWMLFPFKSNRKLGNAKDCTEEIASTANGSKYQNSNSLLEPASSEKPICLSQKEHQTFRFRTSFGEGDTMTSIIC